MPSKKRKQPLGLALRQRRVDAGLSQAALAKAMGCTTGNVSQIERKKWLPTVGYLTKFAAFFKVKVSELIAETE